MSYSRTTWANGQAPAINATHLNNIELGITALDSRDTTVYVDDYVLGAANATAGINQAIAALTAGDTLKFDPHRYDTDGGHTISTPCRVIGPTGRGQTFNQSAQLYLRASANADMLTVASPDVTIRELSMYGNETNQSSTSRGLVTSTGAANSYLLLDAVWVDSFNGDGYYFQSSGGTISGTMINCEARLNDGFGVEFSGTATDMIITNCYIDQNVQSGVFSSAGDVTFSNCHVWGNGTGSSGDRDGMTFQSSSGCRVENSYVEGNHNGSGVRFKSGTNRGHIVSGCDIWDNGRNGIFGFAAQNVVVSGNVIRHNNFSGLAGANGAGIQVDTCSQMLITGNQFYSTGVLRQTYGFFETGVANASVLFTNNISLASQHATGGISTAGGGVTAANNLT